MNARRWTMAELNAMDRDEFTRVVGPVFEHSSWIAADTWSRRPFASLDALHGALVQTVHAAAVPRQVALIGAHPDLVGRAALAGTLTPESAREQADAGLDKLDATDIAAFQRFNHAYRDKFGFPFVICARRLFLRCLSCQPQRR